MKSIAFLPLALMVVGCAAEYGENVGESESELAPGVYAALGDSYSSGLGTRQYVDEGCKRSVQAFGPQIAAARGYELKHVACSGARVHDVRNNQLSALSSATTLVTISVGGNDAGFADVITACAKPWPTTCWGNIDNSKNFIRNQLPGLLDSLYADIRARAPKAKVVVVGYPRIFNGEECNLFARISPGEQAELNNTANLLSDAIGSVARAHGFTYADPRAIFTGHAVCDDVEWVNGLSNPISESYHPNRSGHDNYASLILSLL
ncbi:SGNH/GDSL hydrolase family protein [Pendulispora albinea]|uniref:SGNH/GDSL hydrolase family protein n=1 Tax=Pendulispora albinea TaxID=2741071 RepID=A0ABZ2M4H1_9BACT